LNPLRFRYPSSIRYLPVAIFIVWFAAFYWVERDGVRLLWSWITVADLSVSEQEVARRFLVIFLLMGGSLAYGQLGGLLLPDVTIEEEGIRFERAAWRPVSFVPWDEVERLQLQAWMMFWWQGAYGHATVFAKDGRRFLIDRHIRSPRRKRTLRDLLEMISERTGLPIEDRTEGRMRI